MRTPNGNHTTTLREKVILLLLVAILCACIGFALAPRIFGMLP